MKRVITAADRKPCKACGATFERSSHEAKHRFAARKYCSNKCALARNPGSNLKRHGLTNSPEHRSWLSMMTRCYWSDPSRNDWHLYQGKGITVCDRWHDFANFLADMGPKPSPTHTIERFDASGNYEPSNCKWASPTEQARNVSTNRRITAFGVTRTLAEWAEETGIKRERIADRLNRGWSPEKAVSIFKVADNDKSAKAAAIRRAS